MPIENIYKIGGIGTVVCGRIESGTLQVKKNTDLVFGLNKAKEYKSSNPNWVRNAMTVRNEAEEERDFDHESIDAGQIIGLKVLFSKWDIKEGWAISDSKNDPCRTPLRFIAQIIVMNLQKRIYNGYLPLVYCNINKAPCRFENIIAKVNKNTGEVT